MSDEGSLDLGRFARTMGVIAIVTSVFIFLTANRLGEQLFRIGAIGIGSVALITAIVGFLIAAGRTYDEEVV